MSYLESDPDTFGLEEELQDANNLLQDLEVLFLNVCIIMCIIIIMGHYIIIVSQSFEKMCCLC